MVSPSGSGVGGGIGAGAGSGVAVGDGVTGAEAVDVGEAPSRFVATTVNVYGVRFDKPDTVHEVEVAGDGEHVNEPGDEVTV